MGPDTILLTLLEAKEKVIEAERVVLRDTLRPGTMGEAAQAQREEYLWHCRRACETLIRFCRKEAANA